jgi:hypothetical protein
MDNVENFDSYINIYFIIFGSINNTNNIFERLILFTFLFLFLFQLVASFGSSWVWNLYFLALFYFQEARDSLPPPPPGDVRAED